MRQFQFVNVNEPPSLEPIAQSVAGTNSYSIEFCEEDQPEIVDSKEQLGPLLQEANLNNNNTEQHSCDHRKQLNDLDIKITQCIKQNNQTHLKLDDFKKTVDVLLQKLGLSPFDHPTETNHDDADEDNLNVSSKFDVIDGKISKCILSNKLTHLKIDKLQQSLDLILKNIDNILMKHSEPSSTEFTEDNDDSIGFSFPISTVSELSRLDQELHKNDALMTKLIEKFTKVAGGSGNKSVQKVGVQIIETIISDKLLTKFTWTGRTNGLNNVKLAFGTYSSIFSLCHQVISKADRSFNADACENFLKYNIFKHSSSRLSRKFNNKTKGIMVNDETWSTTSDMQSQSNRCSLELDNSERRTDIEENTCDEDMDDSRENIIQEETNGNLEEENSLPKQCDHESKLTTLETKITICVESNKEVHSKIDTMQETLNAILTKITKHNSFDGVPVSVTAPSTSPPSKMIYDELALYNFPITTVSELQDLNKRLSTSKTFEGKMIKKFTSIAGHAKNISTKRFGLAVVESVISTQLLVKYSWTGRSKTAKRKNAFVKYKYLVEFFQKIIARIDNNFTPKKCEIFLRASVFKNIHTKAARTRIRQRVQIPLTENCSDQEYNQASSTKTSRLTVRDVYSRENQKEQYGGLCAVKLARQIWGHNQDLIYNKN